MVKGRGVLVGIGVVLLVGMGSYLAPGFAVGHREPYSAEQVLTQAGRDSSQIGGLINQVVELSNTTTAVPQATIDKLLTRMEQSRQTIGVDLSRLRSVDDHLRSESVNRLLVLDRWLLNQERRRLELVMAAFSAADEMFDVADRQIHLALILTDVIAAVNAMAPLQNESDVADALESLPRLEQELQQAVQLSKGKGIPPEQKALTSHLVGYVGDLEQLLQAVQVGDVARFREASTRLAQDVQDVNGYVQRATNAYDRHLFASYVERYRRSLREAGLQPGS